MSEDLFRHSTETWVGVGVVAVVVFLVVFLAGILIV